MDIDINGVSITLTQEQLDQVAKHLAKPMYPPKGTICIVRAEQGDLIRVSDGIGNFYIDGFLDYRVSTKFDHYEVLPMGISFSDTPITSSQITSDMHKKLALCWDFNIPSAKYIRVVNANTQRVFSGSGANTGSKFDSYALCTTPIGNLPKMYRDMIDACKD